MLGDELWQRFNSGKERQQWWYRTICEVAERRIPDCELLPKYREKVDNLGEM